MKKLLIFCFAVILLGGCKKDEPIKNVCNYLLQKGNADKSQLLAKWDFAAFAYTADGIDIKNEIPITSCGFWDGTGSITIVSNGIDCSYNNRWCYKYSLTNSNNITLTPHGIITMKGRVCHFEDEILIALDNAECFVVKGQQLIIHYKEQNNRNILILNKSE